VVLFAGILLYLCSKSNQKLKAEYALSGKK
jgi:hypothetical protein